MTECHCAEEILAVSQLLRGKETGVYQLQKKKMPEIIVLQ